MSIQARNIEVKNPTSKLYTYVVAETEGFHLIENRKQLTSYAGLDVRAT